MYNFKVRGRAYLSRRPYEDQIRMKLEDFPLLDRKSFYPRNGRFFDLKPIKLKKL